MSFRQWRREQPDGTGRWVVAAARLRAPSQRFRSDDRDPGEVGQEWAAQIRDQFAALPRDRYPYLLANLDVMVNGAGDERFAFGVGMLIAGMAAQIPAGRGRAGVTSGGDLSR